MFLMLYFFSVLIKFSIELSNSSKSPLEKYGIPQHWKLGVITSISALFNIFIMPFVVKNRKAETEFQSVIIS